MLRPFFVGPVPQNRRRMQASRLRNVSALEGFAMGVLTPACPATTILLVSDSAVIMSTGTVFSPSSAWVCWSS